MRPASEWVRRPGENATGRMPVLRWRWRMAAVAKSDKSKKPTVPAPRVLIVDDEPGLLEVIGDVVGPRGMGCKIISAGTIAQAKKILLTQGIDLMVADVHLPDGDGMSLLPALRQFQPLASAIVMTGSPSV